MTISRMTTTQIIAENRKRRAWMQQVDDIFHGALPDYPWERCYIEGLSPREAVDDYLEGV